MHAKNDKIQVHMYVCASDYLVRKIDLDAIIGKALFALKRVNSIIIKSGATISDVNLIRNLKLHYVNVGTANRQGVPIKGIGDFELFNKSSKSLCLT